MKLISAKFLRKSKINDGIFRKFYEVETDSWWFGEQTRPITYFQDGNKHSWIWADTGHRVPYNIIQHLLHEIGKIPPEKPTKIVTDILNKANK